MKRLLVLSVVVGYAVFMSPALGSPAGAVWAQSRIGSVRAPFDTEAIPEVRSDYQAYALIAGGSLSLSQTSFGVRVPFATSSVEQPAGSYVADATLGNPELFAETLLIRSESAAPAPTRDRRLTLRLALGLPIAGSGPSRTLVRNRVLAASDGILGWQDPELYRPGVLPVTPGLRFAWSAAAWSFSTCLEAPLLWRVGNAHLGETSRPPILTVMPLLHATGELRAFDWLKLGAVAAAVAQIPTHLERDIGRSGWMQVSTGPSLTWLPSDDVVLSTDALLALGGPLRGTLSLGFSARWVLGENRM